jgi:hypothetical protein
MHARSWLSALPLPGWRYNERTGTALNRVQVPSDIVFLFCRLRYKLSLRDLAEMFLIRGIVFTHEAVRDWEARLAPLLAEASPWGSGRLRPGHRFCRQCPPLPAPDIRALFIERHALNRVRHRMVRQDHRSDLGQSDRQDQHLGQRQGMDHRSDLSQRDCWE